MDTDVDLLSELLAPLRLHGVFHSHWTARAPWGVAGAHENGALLHFVREGSCVVELPGTAPLTLRTGDLALFPHGTGHRLGDRPGRPTIPLSQLLPQRPPDTMRVVTIDGAGAVTTMLCGGLRYDRAAAAPLYRALPPVLVLDAATVAAEPLLAGTLRELAAEWDHIRAGGRLVALRAFELVFVLALRVALDYSAQNTPLVRAMRHPAISRVLFAIHTRYAEPWTLESLAAEAGMSRSAFAATFRRLVGEAPMRHLMNRRLQEAARLLGETSLTHDAIAARVGYGSSTGLHLAFRNWSGQTPGEYRRARLASARTEVSA